jgi:hypothetical protein
MIMRDNTPARLTRLGLVAALGFAAAALAFGPTLTSAQAQPRDPAPTESDRPGTPKADPDRPRDGDRGPARRDAERERGREPADPRAREEVEKARRDLEEAREQVRRATERMRDAEERLSRLEGRRPGEAPGRGPAFGGGGAGGFGRPERPELPAMPGGGGGFGGGRGPGFPGFPEPQIRDLQRQIQELREMMDEIRRDLRRDGDRGAPRPRDARPVAPRPGASPRPEGGTDTPPAAPGVGVPRTPAPPAFPGGPPGFPGAPSGGGSPPGFPGAPPGAGGAPPGFPPAPTSPAPPETPSPAKRP